MRNEMLKIITELQNSIESQTPDYEKLFYKIAQKLMNEYCLTIGDNQITFKELEFYHKTVDKNGLHCDPYTHGNDLQFNAGTFYVHESNGTYGGIDITFGKPNKYYGGILIRGIQVENQKHIHGPNRVKKELCKLLKIDVNYKALQKACDMEQMVINTSLNNHGKNILRSIRHGLSPKPEDHRILGEEIFYGTYLFRLYRFIIDNSTGIVGILNAREYNKINTN
jgi:3-methyladenine DNA glycosylase Mpg